MVNIKEVKADIRKLEKKKARLNKDYPTTYQDIADKYGITFQYVFKIRKQIPNLKEILRVRSKR